MSHRMILSVAAVTLASWFAAPRPGRAADAYKVDPVHSSTVFRVKHLNTSYAWGRFNEIGGTFVLDEANPAQSRFEFEVKTGSIDTANAKRDQHLKSPDFFNAVQFPAITFKSKSVAKSGGAYEVTGDLTLHGVTRPVALRIVQTGAAKNPMGKAIVGIDTNFTIKQSDFGMSKMVGPLGDEVWVNVSIEAGKQ